MINDDQLFATLCPNGPYETPTQLINLWIKYDDEGVPRFFNQLKAATCCQPNLAQFLLNHYLINLPQWDHLYDNQVFFNCIDKISRFDADKLACLKKFLEHTGSSRHNLSQTITSFENFWNELYIICNEQGVSIAGINQSEWHTPHGGDPIVYMERLLFILKNARDLDDQFKLLDGIILDNYGAYYASRYEGFKTVSKAMSLNYDADMQNNQPFNRDFYLYRLELDKLSKQFVESHKYYYIKDLSRFYNKSTKYDSPFYLINCSSELRQPLNLEKLEKEGLAIPYSDEDFVPPYQLYSIETGEMKFLMAEKLQLKNEEATYAECFRFIGMQNSGITVNNFSKEFAKFKQNFFSSVDLSGELVAMLYFVTHERYEPNQLLNDLFWTLNRLMCHPKLLWDSIGLLTKLYKLDIKLNQDEGMTLFSSIAGMNSCEFEGLGLSKKECIEKLLSQLEKNKFATFKFFDFRSSKCNPQWPFLYALDTAEVLAEDDLVAAAYHDDLLLFAGLINSNAIEAYYHALDKSEKDRRSYHVGRVRHFLKLAAEREQPNNLQYAIQVIINSKNFITYNQFLHACAFLEAPDEFKPEQVDFLLSKTGFKASAELPALFRKDNADLKAVMILLIIKLKEVKASQLTTKMKNTLNLVSNKVTNFFWGSQHDESSEEFSLDSERFESEPVELHEELSGLSISELTEILEKEWQEAGTLLSVSGKVFLNKILKMTKDHVIKSAFNKDNANGLLKVISEKIDTLLDFQDYGDFEKINRIAKESEKIACLFEDILKNPFVKENEQQFITLFTNVDFAKVDYETLYAVLFLLNAMPQRNYLSLLSTIFADAKFIGNKKQILELLDRLSALNNNYFPAEYLDAFSKLVIANPGEREFSIIINQMVSMFDIDAKDPILELLMTNSKLTFTQVTQIANLCEGINNNRGKISQLLNELKKNNQLESFLQMFEYPKLRSKQMLEIISKGHSLNHLNKRKNNGTLYTELASLLSNLSNDQLGALHQFYKTTPVSANCLLNALKISNHTDDFEQFLREFEKAPFGERNLESQFSVAEVERVVNQSKDLVNDSVYSYQYRKQMMEAFLFVNEIGEHLPIYYNKPAKELSNEEIKSFFTDLKAKKIPDLTPFQNRLLALGLMREAMYRSTGEFPYSTQIIAIIDGMMHQGDLISNIDTGEGKSLTDSLKAALLWLDSDRIDITTSSLVDAKRDIENYGPFLDLLGIPYTKMPIISLSTMDAFQRSGVNFSTFGQLSLFFAKAKVTGVELDTENTVVSLVANESDYAILDDRVIYRFATSGGSGLGYGKEWIYYAINEFVTHPEFISNDKTTARDDIDDLKAYLRSKGAQLKKSVKIIDKFDDGQYLSWLVSALMANFVLRENKDYVIPDAFEKKIINGTEFHSKVVKVLMKNGKVSSDSTFGNGIQQLLCARLNVQRGRENFIIEPQNNTIISTNNKNFIDYYRTREGFIWGSSGTVGSRIEILEQYRKYGFEFSKTEPHQKNRVKFNKPIIAKDESSQFNKLIELLTAQETKYSTSPSIVFCKDINTAIRLYDALEEENTKHHPIQLYTGLGKEEDYITQASQPGMITVTTSALGRNTDIHYDRTQCLTVWHTFIDSTRGSGQKSGRTGRQGSAGEVNYVLNAKELGEITIEQIQLEYDELATCERNASEMLYNLLGYLLAEVDKLPDEQFSNGKTSFLRESWSVFSEKIESRFREIHNNTTYNNDEFTKETVACFNLMMKEALDEPVIVVKAEAIGKRLMHHYIQKQAYKPNAVPVKLSDCTPPFAIAYHMLGLNLVNEFSQDLQCEVNDQLTKLFDGISNGDFISSNRDYLQYLVASPETHSIIVDMHKDFVTKFLQAHSQRLNFFERWLGYESKLNNISNNTNYLLMFHAFASISNKPMTEKDVLVQAIKQLLDEYLETSWFISSERKAWAQELILSINEASSIDDVIHRLSKSQVSLAEQDVDENKKRLLKPLHLFGDSRLQTTISRSLNLAISLSGKANKNELPNELEQLMSNITNKPALCGINKALSKKTDRFNASVISKALKNASIITDHNSHKGMMGRNQFFYVEQSNEFFIKDNNTILPK